MKELIVSAHILKAAKLFIDREFERPWLTHPWAIRMARRNVVFASDGYAMFVANDQQGSSFPRRGVQVGTEDGVREMPPGWAKIIRDINEKRAAYKPVPVDPKLHARVIRAARILEIDTITMSAMSHPSAGAFCYGIGPDAWACVMPKHDFDRPVVPDWLRKVTA